MTLHAEKRPTLDGLGLSVPGLQADPFPIRLVSPSPCTEACPAGINVKSYVSLIAESKFAEALAVVRERCPLPGVCGRICHHPCEAACKRGEIDEPVAIRSLKRFVSDLGLEAPPSTAEPVTQSETVAVIGSGPAGLTAAWDLRTAGYRVTVFESEPLPGGMLRYGIADYRLPCDVLDTEIGALTSAGIELQTGCRIGADRGLEELLASGFSAVLFAVGAQLGSRLELDGEEKCAQVEDALSFLRRINAGDRSSVQGKVVVVGGGSTAIEAARTARRLGAEKVEILYRRHRGEMPADEEEIALAASEGIGLRLLTAPSRLIVRGDTLEGLECLQVALGEPDASGRRRPIPVPGSEFRVFADRILTAIGQRPRLDFLPPDVAERMCERGFLDADPETTMTPMQGVFAAGDVVTGPSTVIHAIAAGHRAADAILDYLDQSRHPTWEDQRVGSDHEWEIPAPPPPFASRRHPPHERLTAGREFGEVEAAFGAADAVAEARRCMRCGPCSECSVCAPSCGRRHISLRLGKVADEPNVVLRAPVRVAAALESSTSPISMPTEGWLVTPTDGSFEEASRSLRLELYPSRVTVDPLYCRGCTRCIDVCSFGAIEIVDPLVAEATVAVSPALCRGCNLCSTVCPTDAVVQAAFAPAWWGQKIEDLYPALIEDGSARPSLVALTCQRRADAVARSLAELDLSSPVHLVPVRCVGQADAGLLLELYRNGADRIVVAGCLSGSCRYAVGPQLAAEQVQRARVALSQIGADPADLVTDWAADAKQPLTDPRPHLAPAAASGRPAGRDRELADA